jgi:hypothetical protein
MGESVKTPGLQIRDDLSVTLNNLIPQNGTSRENAKKTINHSGN